MVVVQELGHHQPGKTRRVVNCGDNSVLYVCNQWKRTKEILLPSLKPISNLIDFEEDAFVQCISSKFILMGYIYNDISFIKLSSTRECKELLTSDKL